MATEPDLMTNADKMRMLLAEAGFVEGREYESIQPTGPWTADDLAMLRSELVRCRQRGHLLALSLDIGRKRLLKMEPIVAGLAATTPWVANTLNGDDECWFCEAEFTHTADCIWALSVAAARLLEKDGHQ